TTGYAEFYTKLFWNTNPKFSSYSEKYLIEDLTQLCMTDQSLYSFTLPSAYLEKGLEALGQALTYPVYTDRDIKNIYKELRRKGRDQKTNPEAFINAAIDSRIYSQAPWKRDTGFYGEFFSSQKTEKIRNNLVKIGKKFYTPERSALIITSPFTDEEVVAAVKKYFSEWENYRKGYESENVIIERNRQGKYVLVTEAISAELNQIVVQYEEEAFFKDEKIRTASLMASLAMNQENSAIKAKLCSEEKLGIIAGDYIDTSFSNQGKNSRLIIQALMQSAKASPTVQEEIFVSDLNENTVFQMEDYLYAKRKLTLQEKLSEDSALQFAQSLAYSWVYEKEGAAKKLRLLSEKIDENQMKTVFALKPYVFLLVNPATFAKHKKDFENSGYEIITEKTAWWFENPVYEVSIKKDQDQENQEEISSIDISSIKNKILESSQENSENIVLENGIPLFYSLNPQSATTSILIHFEGGESIFKGNMRGMQTILLKSLAKTIEYELEKACKAGAILDSGKVSASSGIYSGNVCITCTNQDFPIVCSCINRAMVFGKITPYMEDELIYNEKTRWRFLTAQLDFQLKCKALTAFYRNTNLDGLFNCANDILENISFDQIRNLYPEILNSSRMSLVLTGNPDKSPDEIKNLLSMTFAVVLETPYSPQEKTQINFTPVNQVSKLRRIFTSNIKAEDAGPRPEHLVPTTEFFDPAVVLFRCPGRKRAEYADFIFSLNCLKDSIQKDFDSEEKNAAAKEVSVLEFPEIDGIAGLQFEQVKNSKKLFQYFAEKCRSYRIISQDELDSCRIRWTYNEFKNYETSEKLAAKIDEYLSLGLEGNFQTSLYESISNLEAESVNSSLQKYLKNAELFWIFSADTEI
nr:insulinase family protein [Treponemataceae bacterium]